MNACVFINLTMTTVRMRHIKGAVAASVLAAGLSLLSAAHAQVFTGRPEDHRAVYLDAPEFKAKGDGVADDTEALQAAINAVQTSIRRGVVFVPEGRYRITKPVYVWAGIRLMGFGSKRPTFVLADKTPGYQGDGTPGGGGPQYMLQFVNEPPRNPGDPVADGNPGSFYSAMNNINIEIGEGNPAAVGVRFHVAQHCFLSHINFHIGSGRAGIDGAGNEAEDCEFFGGEFGIITGSTAPSWPFLLIDSHFEGQRQAGIQTELAGLTLVRVSFKNEPVAVAIPDRLWEALFMKDCRLESIPDSGIVIGNEASKATRINLENIVCLKTPVFVTLEPGNKKTSAPDNGALYEVRQFSHGLRILEPGAAGETKTTIDMASLAAVPQEVRSDIPALPPGKSWVDVTTLGLKGDNFTDNTAALKAAIAKHRTLFFPIGRYRVTDTITLRPGTVLIGLHPMATQLVLPDGTPAFNGNGGPKALLETPERGSNIVMGIGLDAGNNLRAIGAKWMAGKNSYMNDVKFVGGHGTFTPEGNRVPAYNRQRGGDADPNKQWDVIPYSLWITKNGGGTFKDIWSANPQAKAGICISDTSTEGRMYAVSVEHHVSVEVKLENVSNWRLYAVQTEEERLEGPKVIAWDIENCHDITFGNLWLFRMATTPGPFGVRLKDCSNINIKGVRCYSPSGKTTFQNPFYDVTMDKFVNGNDIGWLTVQGKPR
jgi:hypothetical protein